MRFCTWGRLEPAFGGNRRSGVPAGQSSRRVQCIGAGPFSLAAFALTCMNRHARHTLRPHPPSPSPSSPYPHTPPPHPTLPPHTPLSSPPPSTHTPPPSSPLLPPPLPSPSPPPPPTTAHAHTSKRCVNPPIPRIRASGAVRLPLLFQQRRQMGLHRALPRARPSALCVHMHRRRQ